jgi:hypothetical protein
MVSPKTNDWDPTSSGGGVDPFGANRTYLPVFVMEAFPGMENAIQATGEQTGESTWSLKDNSQSPAQVVFKVRTSSSEQPHPQS